MGIYSLISQAKKLIPKMAKYLTKTGLTIKVTHW